MEKSNLSARSRCARLYAKSAYRKIIHETKARLLWNYYYSALREPKVKGSRGGVQQRNPVIWNTVETELMKRNVNLESFRIDLIDYRLYMNQAKYHEFRDYYNGGKRKACIEKSLEHYLAAKLLELSRDDTYLDIASSHSPAPEIYHQLYGCKVYRQDLEYPKGIQGNMIGGSASDMPIEDGYATKMALHCSFEHFEDDQDIGFMKEANRVLRRGGRLCIVPLYFFDKYTIQTDPVVLPRGGIGFEKDATLYCAKGWGERHGRFYDVQHFVSRIVRNLNELKLTVYTVQNAGEIDSYCYVRFIGLFEKSR